MLVLLGVRGFVINRPIGHLIEHQHSKAIPVQLIHIQILNAHEGFLLIQRQNFCVIVFVEDIFDDCAALRPHELSHINAEDEAAFDEFIAECKSLSLYDTGVAAAYGDKLITLSTCEYSRTNGRMVIVAKLVVPSAEEVDADAGH